MESLSPSDPQQIGPYKVRALLGRGGMGAVYLCVDQSGNLAAVKIMTAASASQQQQVLIKRFKHEIEATMRVAGDYTAKVLNYSVSGSSYWYASEYIVGPNLADVMQLDQLTVKEIFNFTWSICLALRQVHKAGVVHRDVKPSNIIVGERGIKLVDFGIANIADLTRITSSRASSIGTPAFMAPEYINDSTLTTGYDIFHLE